MPPNIIHHIKFGNTISEIVDQCLHSWQILKTIDFEIKIWDYKTVKDFIATEFLFALETFVNSRNLAEAADLARYLIVHYYGGYYIDWDVQLLDPVRFLKLMASKKNGFLIVDPFNDTIASEVFAAKSKEQYLLDLSQDIVQVYNTGLQSTMKTPQFSGPYRMRDALKKHKSSQSLLDVNKIFVYNYREIREMPEREITQPLIHYWIHSWL